MNLTALHTLVSVERMGSFAQVAARQHMTLSTVSMQMKALEARLGAALFDRTVRPPRLTALGRRVARQARQVIAAEEALIGLCADTELRGSITVGFVLTASVRLLPRFLERAQARHPEARFECRTGLSDRLTRSVRDGELDAAIATRPGAGEAHLDVRSLVREELVFALPAVAAELAVPALMERLPFIQFTPETGIGTLISGYLAAAGWAPRRTIVLDGIEAVMACVRRGIGFTALPQPDVRRYADAGIVERPMGEPPLMRELVLLTSRASSARHRAHFAELFDDEPFGDGPP